jgi:hypothetical protein
MKIISDKGVFDLPDDFGLEVTESNPLFSKSGAQTIPVTVPPSDNNFRICGEPGRVDFLAPPENIPVTVSFDTINKKGSFVISSADDETGIDGTVYFDDGDFYGKIKNVKLNEMKVLPLRDEWNGDINALVAHLTAVMRGDADDDFMIFPAVVEYKQDDEGGYATGTILNETKSVAANTDEVLVGSEPYTFVSDGMTVTLPIGYGITPFLKISVLIDYVFREIGYELSDNPWAKGELASHVVLNNTADTCLKAKSATYFGALDYKQITPADILADFIDMLFVIYGQVLFVNGSSRTARFVPVADIVTGKPDLNFTDKLSSKITVFFEKGKQLNLSAGNSYAAPGFDSYGEMMKSYAVYGNPLYCVETDFTDVNESNPDVYLFVVRASTGNYHLIRTGTSIAPLKFIRLVSSPYFNYAPESTLEKDERSAKCELAGMDFPRITDSNGDKPLRLTPMFLAGVRHFNSELRVSDGSIVKDDKGKELKTAFCVARGRAKAGDGSPLYYFYGSTQRYDNAGNEETGRSISLQFQTPDGSGIYDRLFREFEEFLKLGTYFEFEATLDDSEISALDLSKPKHLKNRNLLIEELKYSMDTPDRTVHIKAKVKQ